MMFRKVCAIEFARMITAMFVFVNPRCAIAGESASRISAKLFVCMPGTSPLMTPSANPIDIESASIDGSGMG
jgi:hypothetical protein